MTKIEVSVLSEDTHHAALYGLGLSHGLTSDVPWSDFVEHRYNPETEDIYVRLSDLAEKLAPRGGGHNKFLESIHLTLLVNAPRYWWQEADTYRLTTKQSESTMHTLTKGVRPEHFEFPDTLTQVQLDHLNYLCAIKDLVELKSCLPEGFMQKRVWKLNYMTLRNIITQRQNHRLPHWKEFCRIVREEVRYPEYLPTLEK
jgi:hypothetical protein